MSENTVDQIKQLIDKDRKPLSNKVAKLQTDLQEAEKSLANFDQGIAKDLGAYLSAAPKPSPKKKKAGSTSSKPKYTDDQWRKVITTILTGKETLTLDELYGQAKEKLGMTGRGNFKATVERIVNGNKQYTSKGGKISLTKAAA